MITFQEEEFIDIIDELKQLNYNHWEEVERYKDSVPLDVNYNIYLKLEEVGALHVMTARENDLLIGYYISLIQPSLHHQSSIFAISDVIFIDKNYRKGTVGYRLVKETIDSLTQIRGVDVVQIVSKATLDLYPITKRLGFEQSEIVYSKYVGED